MLKDFEELSIPLQKRRIVKDAITQIRAGIIVPAQGDYFTLLSNSEFKDLQKILKLKQEETCEACAKGTLFAACVLNVNKVKKNEAIGDEKFQKRKLKKWFSPLELDMIETAFEGEEIVDSTNKITPEMREACVNFGEEFYDPKERLLAILENILENKVFKP